ncbi:MAG TPA: DUF4167 domain-containing protein [Alphaproteobacteria bacterium]|nr:DUF4167 domain-containing protein [Alphaproteobacteria bacterium]
MNNSNRPRSAASLRHQTFDSHCLDVRVRGNAWQVYEKYQAIARDAQSAGDRVAAENYLQHAEHYYRIIEAINEATAVEQRQRPGGAPASPFGDQPSTPSNYFGPEGGLSQPPAPDGNTGAPATQSPPAAQQAAARNPQAQQNPFFQPEEEEEQGGGPEPLAARR